MKTNDIIKAEKTNPQTRSPQEIAKQKRRKQIAKRAGENIRLRREEMELSQEKLAKLVHVKVEKIIQYENGALMPNLINIWEIAKKLECTVDDLLTFDSKRTKNAAKLNSEIKEDERKEKKEVSAEAKKLGQNIKNRRLALDISQARLAKDAKVSVLTISRYETASHTANGAILQRIAERLKTTTGELWNGDFPASERPKATRSPNVVKTNPGERRKEEKF